MANEVTVKKGGKLYAIPFEEIVCFEKNLRKIRMHTNRGSIEYYGTFAELLPELDERFLCCHRSYVLNMDMILCFGRSEIIMANEIKYHFGSTSYLRGRKIFEDYIAKKKK